MSRPVRVLPVLTTLFAASLLGRSIAVAVEYTDDTPNAESVAPVLNDDTSIQPALANDCVSPKLGEALQKRQVELEAAELALLDRVKTQDIVKEELDHSMKEIDALASAVEEKVTLLETSSHEDIAHLTKMYENMKPAQASEIFNKMDPIFAAGIFHNMKSNQAGLILANMAPDKAYVISVLMANRLAEYRETDPS